MPLKIGQRLRSQVSGAEVIVVRASDRDVVLTCGGRPMLDPDSPGGSTLAPVAGAEGEVVLGKRYVVGDAGAIEVLATKAGGGLLEIDGTALVPAQAKSLPASD